MSVEIRLPQYGMAMQEGTVVQWFKKEGDGVEAGDILAEIEAEKATEELVAQENGVLQEIVVPEGATVPVNEVLALLSSAVGGEERTAREPEMPAGPPAVAAPDDVAQEAVVAPLSGMRATIAARMHASLQSMAQLTLVTTADVTDLVAYRERLAGELRPTYTDMLVRAAAIALRRHPGVNSTLDGDRIRSRPDIHVGIATDVPGGLLVPVVRNADRKSLRQLAAESAVLTRRAREGVLRIEEITGATFTVTSLGGQGIDAFTPIINPPEVAILGVGRIVEQPARGADGALVWRHVITLSLTIDHRVVDGAPGAAFLASVGSALGDIGALEGEALEGEAPNR
jgi:pyruvate/2-oxoglutarate dehydrogenase complex dihydrolipoamide acyltransferase (E2) component